MPANSPIIVPETIPIIVLSQCTLFPHSLMPLFIFEPRYREMLAYALEQSRMFAIGHLEAGPEWGSDEEADERIRPITTCGVVRACVGRPDGTSHLMLQGVRRVRITDWVQKEPFRIARIQVLPILDETVTVNASRAASLLELLRQLLPATDQIDNPLLSQLAQVQNLEMLLDIVTANFIIDGTQRQQFLELPDLEARWHFLTARLSELLAT
jgi:Lon protease-like protein